MYPTWSPDGRAIALQEYEARPKPPDPFGGQIRMVASNYVLVDVEPPHRRRLLFANPRRRLGWRQEYFGPAIWAPDSRLLVLGLLGPWLASWFVLDSHTGDLQRLPDIPAGNDFTVGGRV